LAFSRNKTRDNGDEYTEHTGPLRPEKVVIVAGPSFGAALEFMLLGVVIGVAGALVWQKQKGAASLTGAMSNENIVVGSAPDTTPPAMSQVLDRAGELARRAKVVAARARETVRSVGEAAGPAIGQAIAEGRTAARETEEQLAQEISKNPASAPGTTSITGDQA